VQTADELLNSATPQDIRGRVKNADGDQHNIFTYYRIFRASVNKVLGIEGGKS
jgi:CRISPR system Cascade subunit CasA